MQIHLPFACYNNTPYWYMYVHCIYWLFTHTCVLDLGGLYGSERKV